MTMPDIKELILLSILVKVKYTNEAVIDYLVNNKENW